MSSSVYFLLIAGIWIILCVFSFQKIGVNRYKKIISKATNECRVNASISELYHYYNSAASKYAKLYFAMNIASFLNQIGRSKEALELITKYDAEKIFKLKRDQILKFNYYLILAGCLRMCGSNDEGLRALEKAGEILQNCKQKGKQLNEEYYALQKRLINLENEDGEDIVRALDEYLLKCKSTLEKVSYIFKSVQILLSLGRSDEAQEKIEYLAKNGGDTLAGRCARDNNFTTEFIDSIKNEPFELKAAHIKKHKTVLVSIVLVILTFAITLLAGILNRKTIYITGTNDDFLQHTFNVSGEYDSWISMDTVYYDSSEYIISGLDIQNLFASFYENREGIYITRTTTDEFARCRIDVIFEQLNENSTRGFDKSFFYTEDEFLASLDGDRYYAKYIKIFNIPIYVGIVP